MNPDQINSSSTSPYSSKKVLVVEDEPLILKAICDKLNREGLQTLQAVNGEEGLNNAIANHPDLILLDINMPVMDGITMLRKLRQDSWGQNAEVAMLTNLNDNFNINEGMKLKVTRYLVKSDARLEEVVDLVKQILTANNSISSSPLIK